jgi:hypothetical protein
MMKIILMKKHLINLLLMAKKQLRVFGEYYEAVLCCILNDIEYKRISKHPTRPNTSRDWVVVQNNKKVLRDV